MYESSWWLAIFHSIISPMKNCPSTNCLCISLISYLRWKSLTVGLIYSTKLWSVGVVLLIKVRSRCCLTQIDWYGNVEIIHDDGTVCFCGICAKSCAIRCGITCRCGIWREQFFFSFGFVCTFFAIKFTYNVEWNKRRSIQDHGNCVFAYGNVIGFFPPVS